MNLQTSATLPAGLEPLEARSLFSAFVYQSIIDHLDLTAPLRDVAGPNDGSSGFGAVVAGLGDINNDGFSDFAVAAPGSDSPSPLGVPGSVYIYSGQDGQLIRTLTDGAGGFGLSMTNVGDVNADGVPDLLVGSPWRDAVEDSFDLLLGGASVYSGADGTVLRTFIGNTVIGEFGRVVVRAVDINEDGVVEFIIGAPASGLDGAGQVFVFSGIDGALLHTLEGEAAGDRFGASIAAASERVAQSGEIGFLVVGSPLWGSGGNGRISAFGADGSLLYTIQGNDLNDRFGSSVAIGYFRDVYQQPFPSHFLFVGIPGKDTSAGQDAGAIRRVSLANGDGIYDYPEGAHANGSLGRSITNVGDLDGDGSDDLLTVEDSESGPVVRYLTSTEFGWQFWDTAPIGPHDEHAPALAGGIAPVGDINHDGFPDVITGDGIGRVTILSSLALAGEVFFEGASPNQLHFWSQGPNRQYVYLNGRALAFSEIPGLTPRIPGADPMIESSRIVAILNDGTIFYYNAAEPGSGGGRTELMALIDGVGTPLSELVTSIPEMPSPPITPLNYDAMVVTKVSSSGRLLLTETEASRVWTYFEGVLSFVWYGIGNDINSSGVVVGLQRQNNDSYLPAMRAPGSAAVVLEGLESAGAINDDNVVAGTLAGTSSFLNPGHIATWDDGVVTDLAAGPNVYTSTVSATWVFRGINADGLILADVVTNAYRGPTTYSTYLYEPGIGLRSLRAATVGAPNEWYASVSIRSGTRIPTVAFSPDGAIIAYNAVLTSDDDSVRFTIRDGSPTAMLSTDEAQYILGINQFNELIVVTNTGSGWTGRTLRTGIPDSMSVGIAAFFEASTSRALAVLSTGDEVWLILLNDVPSNENAEILLSNSYDRLPIERGLTVFTNVEGIAHIAGIDENGDVVIFYRNPSYITMVIQAWNYNNLSDHLEAQALETPDFVGGLTAFTTTWSAMNINGLDAEGHVRTIWWAPGMTLWYTNDLTAETDTTPLHGQLTSYSTPWGTLHMTGLNEDGDVTTMWWAPGFGADWRSDVLAPESIGLDPESLTSYVTPWGGLNIAGRDLNTGRIAVYWWSLESNAWAVDTLDLRDGAESPTMQGESAGSVSESGTISLSVVGTNGSLYRFSWEPGDEDLWTLEDLTALTVG